MPRALTPKIIVPFRANPGEGRCTDFCQDMVVYLRPETNGIQTESVLFRVFKDPVWHSKVELAYLANVPGQFLLDRGVVERHYNHRIRFAKHGADAFTPAMKDTFSRFFGLPFDKARIVGAFEALSLLKLDEEALFRIWVPVYDLLEMEGQLVKRVADDLFVVNYDIPALLLKHHETTDVAAMVFRTELSYEEFKPAVDQIRLSLVKEGLLDPDKPEHRVFHWSRGPFEQLLDAQGYVYTVRDEPVPLSDLAFGRYLLERGESEASILKALWDPFSTGKNLFTATLFDTFDQAYAQFRAHREAI
jgi:hypothetical protein